MDAGEASAKTPSERLAQRRLLRRSLVERRLALSVETCAAHARHIRCLLAGHFPQLAAMRVAFCWPVQNEPDLRPLLTAWLLAGDARFRALLPVVLGEAAPLAFRAWTPTTALIPDRYGIPTPAEGDYLTPEALLLPVNGFDAAGYRLGYGGGFFDRTLAALASAARRRGQPAPLAIGVGYELARVPSIAPETHDLPLAAVVTEAGVFTPR